MKTQNPLSKGLKSTSLRASVDAHCYMCMGGEKDDTRTQKSVVELIRVCSSEICPLWSVRPFTRSNSEDKAGN
ncbi:hypothetical protein EDC23_0792 [Thiohalophilus thiocyanatoxydans]|uniref:Uncharacterized protein n=1 Tax=Thiohalophilus thiocyanatoxydans TaxID=381308 RepID=A0A4R8IYC5_9GAMM|nr:hypothetical protein EDC23_0792 [Thiohalophilus thiocyanatoxydans]